MEMDYRERAKQPQQLQQNECTIKGTKDGGRNNSICMMVGTGKRVSNGHAEETHTTDEMVLLNTTKFDDDQVQDLPERRLISPKYVEVSNTSI
ncbi:hypothetical protein CHS0354_032336 [Potamilus streckersoni]|uniref:Uncharacterized protein n=1 Tax=Potamilus streckersoni TaxID=2493646 RepID=A0AAE0WDW4_9BIVA|nr:hypothetical protein CHS0354_032336 [Potamilus streckersoni]